MLNASFLSTARAASQYSRRLDFKPPLVSKRKPRWELKSWNQAYHRCYPARPHTLCSGLPEAPPTTEMKPWVKPTKCPIDWNNPNSVVKTNVDILRIGPTYCALILTYHRLGKNVVRFDLLICGARQLTTAHLTAVKYIWNLDGRPTLIILQVLDQNVVEYRTTSHRFRMTLTMIPLTDLHSAPGAVAATTTKVRGTRLADGTAITSKLHRDMNTSSRVRVINTETGDCQDWRTDIEEIYISMGGVDFRPCFSLKDLFRSCMSLTRKVE
ncbi:hypothetical protein LA080_016087 [Diaporthe eres]|nr:hypothetical protein LA080_016087 [Diaporthe eres]